MEAFQFTERILNRLGLDTVISEETEKGEEKRALLLRDGNGLGKVVFMKEGKRVEIGSSSECEAYDSKPYDKRYYIEKREFESLDAFRNAGLPYSDKSQITILSIDGISPKKYHRYSL